MIHELRQSLLSSTAFFGCSATMDVETEEEVKKLGGLRAEGTGPGLLEIICTSVDRPDISICVLPILKGKQNNYGQLYFLLNNAVESQAEESQPESQSATSPGGKPSPQLIPKSIVFLDGRKRIADAAKYLKECLVQKGYSPKLAHQTIGVYTAHVPKSDQDRLYSTFCSEQSSIQIMIATTALGMGMDIHDVHIVVQWNFPVTNDIGNLWQRFGCAARGQDKKGIVIFFVPHWAFDRLGYYNEEQSPKAAVGVQSRTKLKKSRNMLARDRQASRLRETFSQESSCESESETALLDLSSCSNGAVNAAVADLSTGQGKSKLGGRHERRGKDDVPPWTKAEIKARDSLSVCWKNMINGDCFRKYPLEFLREDRCDPETKAPSAPPEECCNGPGCNPTLLEKYMTAAPVTPVPLRKPVPKSKAGVALQRLVNWCRKRANELVPSEERLAPMPSAYFLPSRYQWAIAHVFSSRKFRTAADFPLRTIEDLRKIVPPDCWKYAADWEGRLLEFVRQDVDSILAEAAALKAKNDTRPPDSTTSSQDVDSIEGVTAEEWQA